MFEILISGLLFGFAIVYAKLNKFDTISGMATLEDLTVAKAMAFAMGLGIIIFSTEIGSGIASYHIKPFILSGIIAGGILFGIGMAILGYCPGTLIISVGEGSLDAFAGLIGGLLGGYIYTIFSPVIKSYSGPDFGKLSLESFIGVHGVLFYIVSFFIGFCLMAFPFFLEKIDGGKVRKWLYAGIILGILNPVISLRALQNRPIGASTAFVYFVDKITGLTSNKYFLKIQKAGEWEVIFLSGAVFMAFLLSVIKREFKFKLIHKRWEKYKGKSVGKRIFFSLLGGFFLIFGARMAGGCTSGHILSGGMQLAISSIVFGIFVFISLLVTGKLFYKK